jgi:hypothetical protein
MSLFTKSKTTSTYNKDVFPQNTGNLAPDLIPAKQYYDTAIDVVNDFPWTLSPANNTVRSNAPSIQLTEYVQIQNQMNQSLTPYGKELPFLPASQNNATFYENATNITSTALAWISKATLPVTNLQSEYLYEGLFDLNTPTHFKFKLPFFTQSYYDLDNTWKKTDVLDSLTEFQKDKLNALEGVIKDSKDKEKDKQTNFGLSLANTLQIAKDINLYALKGQNPTVGLLDPPSMWESSSPRQYTFQFPLYNITKYGNSNANNIMQQNWELCYLLNYQNIVNKNNFYTGIPPVYYEVLIPGIHYCKASYISSLEILNLGNTRLVNLPVGEGGAPIPVNMPDAYMISITLQDLLMPSKNLLSASINSKVRSQISTSVFKQTTEPIIIPTPINKSTTPTLGGGVYGTPGVTAPLTGPDPFNHR